MGLTTPNTPQTEGLLRPPAALQCVIVIISTEHPLGGHSRWPARSQGFCREIFKINDFMKRFGCFFILP